MATDFDCRAAWNANAAGYQKAHRLPTDRVYYGPWCADESALQLLGDVAGRRILDLGCGGGQTCLALARQGAIVTGVDIADAQLAFAGDMAARQRLSVRFLRGDMQRLDALADAGFDVVLSIYALPYVADAVACLSEAARVLVPGGRFVASLNHPARNVFWDAEAEEEVLYPARSYFQRDPLDWAFADSGVRMHSYHRTLSDWLDALRGAGLRLERLLEPEPVNIPPDALWKSPIPRELVLHVPQTLILVATRP